MIKTFFTAIFLIGAVQTITAQFIDSSADRVKTPLQVGMKKIGCIKPKSTNEITSSRITVGCETMDRGLTIWDNYKSYLKPLGVKKIRLQGGWAKCEKVKGVYDWQWLDDVINYAIANDLVPWLEVSYGNPVYEGGGGTGLLNSLMTSEEGYQAWDKWVAATVNRYKNRVTEWEIWNEPDHPSQKISPETIASLNIRTATIIKQIQPEAKIAGLAFASNSNQEYLDRFLKVIADSGKLNLFHWISYHSYTVRPEDAYTDNRVLGLKKVIEKYSDKILLRQGENGAPSTFIPSFALSNYYWTEYTQAKYDMRRLLGDLGHNIETSVFTIIDIYYKPVLNTKGLIESDTTKAAIRPKDAYYAIQNLAAVFDDNLQLNPDFNFTSVLSSSMSVYGYQHKNNKDNVIALWIDSTNATNSFATTPVTITVNNVHFKTPVWVDLMTGNIYELPEGSWVKKGSSYTFTGIPLYDSPVLIVEKSMLFKKK